MDEEAAPLDFILLPGVALDEHYNRVSQKWWCLHGYES
jgi:Fe-S cluster biosynthesis and repair protein YggX